MKEKAARDREWRERMDKPNRFNSYERHLAAFDERKKLDEANQREIALQKLKNKGLLDVTDRQQTGSTKRTGMEQAGSNKRTGMEQAGSIKRTGMEQAGSTKRTGLEQSGLTKRTGMEQSGLTNRLDKNLNFTKDTNRQKALQDRMKFYSTDEYSKDGLQLIRKRLEPKLAREASLRDVGMFYGDQRPEVGQGGNALSTYTPELGKPLPGNYQQTPLSERPVNTTRQPLGQATIESNLGHVLGLDKAQNISNAFNYGLRGVWQGSTDLGQAMINRGIKPAYNWSTQKYTGY